MAHVLRVDDTRRERVKWHRCVCHRQKIGPNLEHHTLAYKAMNHRQFIRREVL